MNILHEEFFVEKFLQPVLYVVLLWFIMAIIHMQNKVLEKSTLVGTNVQIVVVHRKKTVVFGKI
jgi:cell division protein FtsL